MVALESTILAHGLPAPSNRAAADAIEAAVRAHGAVPATVAVLDGHARVGLSAAGLDRVCAAAWPSCRRRDLGVAVGAAAATGRRPWPPRPRWPHAVGYPALRHRRARRCAPRRPRHLGRSADLGALARTAVLVVCSG